MTDRKDTTKDGFVNLHQTRVKQLSAYGEDIKQKKFSKKVTGKRFRVDK